MKAAGLLLCFALAAAAQPAGTVAGRVLSSVNNSPLAGATVLLRISTDGPAKSYSADSGSDGRFLITGIPPGVYELAASKPGFESRPSHRLNMPPDSLPVTVAAGNAAPPLAIRLTPDGVITGRVIDEDGDPVRHAAVETQQYGYAGGKKILRTVNAASTDDRGMYRLYYVAPGRYYLVAQPTPSRNPQLRAMRGQTAAPPLAEGSAAAFYPGTPDASHAVELEVAPGAELTGIDLRLAQQRLYSIRGRIFVNGPKERLSILAQTTSAMRGMALPARIKGDEFEIPGAAPGRYSVIGQQFPAQGMPGRQYARQTVDVIGGDVENADLSFSPAVILKGVVTAEGGASLKDAPSVTLVAADNPEMMMFGGGAQVGPDGGFSIELAPGVYRVNLNSGQAYLKRVLVGKEPAPDHRIDTAHVSGDLTLVVAADFGKLAGTVTDDAGAPVYHAYVTLIPAGDDGGAPSRFRTAFTKADGTFSVSNVQPGDYRLFAWRGVEMGAPQDPDFRKPFEDRGVAIKMEGNGHRTVDLKAIQPR